MLNSGSRYVFILTLLLGISPISIQAADGGAAGGGQESFEKERSAFLESLKIAKNNIRTSQLARQSLVLLIEMAEGEASKLIDQWKLLASTYRYYRQNHIQLAEIEGDLQRAKEIFAGLRAKAGHEDVQRFQSGVKGLEQLADETRAGMARAISNLEALGLPTNYIWTNPVQIFNKRWASFWDSTKRLDGTVSAGQQHKEPGARDSQPDVHFFSEDEVHALVKDLLGAFLGQYRELTTEDSKATIKGQLALLEEFLLTIEKDRKKKSVVSNEVPGQESVEALAKYIGENPPDIEVGTKKAKKKKKGSSKTSNLHVERLGPPEAAAAAGGGEGSPPTSPLPGSLTREDSGTGGYVTQGSVSRQRVIRYGESVQKWFDDPFMAAVRSPKYKPGQDVFFEIYKHTFAQILDGLVLKDGLQVLEDGDARSFYLPCRLYRNGAFLSESMMEVSMLKDSLTAWHRYINLSKAKKGVDLPAEFQKRYRPLPAHLPLSPMQPSPGESAVDGSYIIEHVDYFEIMEAKKPEYRLLVPKKKA